MSQGSACHHSLQYGQHYLASSSPVCRLWGTQIWTLTWTVVSCSWSVSSPSLVSADPALRWWQRRHSLPRFSDLAQTYLCVQMFSTPSESMFPRAGDTIGPERSVQRKQKACSFFCRRTVYIMCQLYIQAYSLLKRNIIIYSNVTRRIVFFIIQFYICLPSYIFLREEAVYFNMFKSILRCDQTQK